jgi:AcrR family transcriptional regulator
MSRKKKRAYVSEARSQAAQITKGKVLEAAKSLFMRHGIDRVTIEQIARKGGVAVSTVYALYRSKEGVLREVMRRALFGPGFQAATAQLEGVTDAVQRLALTAQVARAIYEGESAELGLLRGASAFSPELRSLEQEFEKIRLDMQQERVRALFDQARQKKGLAFEDARRILWMYTSRDVYRMLVHEGGWTPQRYQAWLAGALMDALVGREKAR